MLERLEKLEAAHNELGAQLTALQITFRTLLPFICTSTSELRAALSAAYDATSSEMDRHGHDQDYQRTTLRWLNEYANVIQGGGYTPHRPQTSDESAVPPAP